MEISVMKSLSNTLLACVTTAALLLMPATRSPAGPPAAENKKPKADASAPSSDVKVQSKDPKFGNRVEKIAKRLAEIRQLKFKRPISAGVMNQKQLAAKLADSSDEEMRQWLKRLRSVQPLLVRLGLVPKDMDLPEFIQSLRGDSISGFYDSRKKELFVIASRDKRGDMEGGDVIIAHELTHALQDQHYDLSAMDDLLKGEDDMELAHKALVEGDATAAMMEYMIVEEDMGPFARTVFRSISNSLMANMDWLMKLPGFGKKDALSKAPNVIRREMLFPYSNGLRFVRYGIGANRWSELRKAHENPPLSTEQILHPSKYFDKEERDWPTQVITPDVGVLLPGKWTAVSRLVIGEFGLRVVLDEHRPENGASEPGEADSREAAAGWDGDEVRFYRDRANPKNLMIIWYSTWDSEKDAIECQQSLVRWVVARHKDAQPVKDAVDCWKVGPNQIRVLRKGNDVILLDAPYPDKQGVVIKALWEKVWKKEIQTAKELDAWSTFDS